MLEAAMVGFISVFAGFQEVSTVQVLCSLWVVFARCWRGDRSDRETAFEILVGVLGSNVFVGVNGWCWGDLDTICVVDLLWRRRGEDSASSEGAENDILESAWMHDSLLLLEEEEVWFDFVINRDNLDKVIEVLWVWNAGLDSLNFECLLSDVGRVEDFSSFIYFDYRTSSDLRSLTVFSPSCPPTSLITNFLVIHLFHEGMYVPSEPCDSGTVGNEPVSSSLRKHSLKERSHMCKSVQRRRRWDRDPALPFELGWEGWTVGSSMVSSSLGTRLILLHILEFSGTGFPWVVSLVSWFLQLVLRVAKLSILLELYSFAVFHSRVVCQLFISDNHANVLDIAWLMGL